MTMHNKNYTCDFCERAITEGYTMYDQAAFKRREFTTRLGLGNGHICMPCTNKLLDFHMIKNRMGEPYEDERM